MKTAADRLFVLPSRPECTEDWRLRGEQRGERIEERSWELLGETGETSGTSLRILEQSQDQKYELLEVITKIEQSSYLLCFLHDLHLHFKTHTIHQILQQIKFTGKSEQLIIFYVTHSAGLFPFIGNMRSSVLGEGVSLSPASRGSAALQELFSSEEEAELWERWGTWRLRCCWPRLSGTSGGRQGECVSVFRPTTLPGNTLIWSSYLETHRPTEAPL